jgi:indolepyruvate ferredoxin oxidoreductase alpha subunit
LDPIIEAHCRALGLSVRGKDLFSLMGEYSAAKIKEVVRPSTADARAVPEPASEPLPARPPVMCAGCPHRAVFFALKQIRGLAVMGDIGCYTLAALPPLSMMDACVCMGASVGMAHGMEKAGSGQQIVAVIGDSTFIHSGITGLIDVVYNKGAATVIILDNSITGMTGHQENPTTGFTIRRQPTRQVDLKKLCEAIGVERVFVVDPFDTEKFPKILREELAVNEPSVLIAQRPCALIKKGLYEGKYTIDKDKCVKCGMCMRIGCPAISRPDDSPFIEASQCVGCGYCARLCKAKAVKILD